MQKPTVTILTVEEEEGTLPLNPLDALIVFKDEVVMSAKSSVSAIHLEYIKDHTVLLLFEETYLFT